MTVLVVLAIAAFFMSMSIVFGGAAIGSGGGFPLCHREINLRKENFFMEIKHGSKETKRFSVRALSKQFPTLAAATVVLLVSVTLLGGRALAFTAKAETTTPQDRQTANVNVANVAAVNNTSTATSQAVKAEIKDGVQYVTSSISGGYYDQITVQQGIPVKWTLNAPSGSLNSCNNSIIIPKYNLQVELKIGENVIEFTPDESGTFPFSCWMGMIRSSITVVGADGTVADNPNDGSEGLPASCCGGKK